MIQRIQQALSTILQQHLICERKLTKNEKKHVHL